MVWVCCEGGVGVWVVLCLLFCGVGDGLGHLLVSVGGFLHGCVACLRVLVVECCQPVGLVVEVDVCGDLCGYFVSKSAF